jgi:hypothetical protein
MHLAGIDDPRTLLSLWLDEVKEAMHSSVYDPSPAKRARARNRLDKDVPRLADAFCDLLLGPAAVGRVSVQNQPEEEDGQVELQVFDPNEDEWEDEED